MNRGFADLRLNHLATPPDKERETRFELATPTLARWCSTSELLPLDGCKYKIIRYARQVFFSVKNDYADDLKFLFVFPANALIVFYCNEIEWPAGSKTK